MFLHLASTLLLLSIGFVGIFFTRKNLVITIMGLEIMILANNMLLAFFTYYLDDLSGLLFIFFLLTVSASETAIGLALVVTYHTFNKLV